LHAQLYRQNKVYHLSYQLKILLKPAKLLIEINSNPQSLKVVSTCRMGCPPHGYSAQLNSLPRKWRKIFEYKYGYFRRCSSWLAIVKTLPVRHQVEANC
jgi:hypothetical protein